MLSNLVKVANIEEGLKTSLVKPRKNYTLIPMKNKRIKCLRSVMNSISMPKTFKTG
jgi:hypothetical protein